VNLSQRLEALNKEFGTRCLMCGTTYDAVAPRLDGIETLGIQTVRNRQEPVAVYVLG
jgi:adenylate cyclase